MSLPLIVYALGPIDTERDGSIYTLSLTRGLMFVDMEVAPTAEAALEALLARHNNERVLAGPELRAEAEALGLRVATHDALTSMMRASQAVAMGNLDLDEGAAPMVEPLLMSLLPFYEAAPWRWIDSDRPVHVTLERGRSSTQLEAAVLGNAGELLGLAIYDEPGALERHAASFFDAPDCVLLTLDDAPAWGVEALRGLGLPAFPALGRLREGRPAPVRAGDLNRLDSVLWAVSELRPDRLVVEGEHDEGPLRVRVELSAPASLGPRLHQKIPRNARCPCGSGRKYKRCCLERDEGTALSSSRSVARGRPERLDSRQAVIDALHAFMRRELPEHEARWCRELLGTREVAPELVPIFTPMLFHDLPTADGQTLTARFLAREGRRLGAQPRRELEAAHAAWPSIWEVLAVEPERGLELIDRLTGERCFVHEVSGTRNMPLRAGLLVRVTQRGERRELDGFYPLPMPPRETDAAVKALRRELKVRKKWIAAERLRTPELARRLFELWHARAQAWRARPEAPIELVNTDGDPLEFVEDHYALLDTPAAALEALLAIPGMVGVVNEEGERGLDLQRAGNREHRTWLRTSVGQVATSPGSLVLRSNSRARADALRGLVEGRLGLLARFVERVCERPPTRTRPGGGTLSMDSQPAGGWMQPPVDLVQRLGLREWMHAPHEELGGLSARAAVEGVATRRKLDLLLREREFEAPAQMWEELVELRAELGVDVLGGRARRSVEERVQARGSSRLLLEFALPLLIGSGDPAEAEAMLRVAAVVWNLGGRGEGRRAAEISAVARGALVAEGVEIEDEQVREWVDVLMSLRELFDDPRLIEIVDFNNEGERFNFRAATRLPQ